MYAAECCCFSADDFTVTSFIDLASAMSADVEAGFDGGGDQIGESFEQSCAKLSALLREFKHFPVCLADWLDCVLCQASPFELREKRINEAGTNLFSHTLSELSDYAVAVSGAFIKDRQYVEPREIRDELV